MIVAAIRGPETQQFRESKSCFVNLQLCFEYQGKLCLHIAYVDFDGAKGIEKVHELPRFQGKDDPSGDAEWVQTYAPRVYLGAQKLREWLLKMETNGRCQSVEIVGDDLSKKRKSHVL